MNPVHIVALYNVHHHPGSMVLRGFHGRVHPPESLFQQVNPLWVGLDNRPVADIFSGSMMGTVRIKPGMEFHAAFVCLFNPKTEWVIKGHRCPVLLPGEEIRPGFDIAFVQRICLRTHLKDHGIELVFLEIIQDAQGFCLLFFSGESGFAGPVDVGHGGNPGSTEFAQGRYHRFIGCFLYGWSCLFGGRSIGFRFGYFLIGCLDRCLWLYGRGLGNFLNSCSPVREEFIVDFIEESAAVQEEGEKQEGKDRRNLTHEVGFVANYCRIGKKPFCWDLNL